MSPLGKERRGLRSAGGGVGASRPCDASTAGQILRDNAPAGATPLIPGHPAHLRKSGVKASRTRSRSRVAFSNPVPCPQNPGTPRE